jgi:hypothetical protein
LSTAAAVGSIATAFLIPIIIHFIHASVLFYIALLFIGGIGLCLFYLDPLTSVDAVKSQQTIGLNLFKNTFFISLFIFTILSLTIIALAQFSFQTALMERHYSQEELATFISIFNGGISIICLVIQATFARRLLGWIGLGGVLLIFPIACFILGFGLAVWPGFIVFIIFNATQLLFGETFMYPCREIMLNPYPSALRKKANMFIRGYATPIGGLVGALMVFIIQQSSIHLLGVAIVFFSALLIYFTVKSANGYQTTLYDSLKENRYAPNFLNLTRESALFMREQVLSSLKSEDLNAIRIALSFYEHENFATYVADQEIQHAILALLDHSEADIRYNTVRALNNLKTPDVVEVLLNHLEHEENNIISSEILDVLCNLPMNASLDEAMHYKNSSNFFLLAYGLILLSFINKGDAQRVAETQINLLLKGGSTQRLLLARIEKYLKPGALQNARLLQLIQDSSDEVSIQAIQSLNDEAALNCISILLEFLNSPHRAYFSRKVLERHLDAILDHLLKVEPTMPRRQIKVMLRLLAKSSKLEALNKLVELSKTQSIDIRYNIAQFVARYSPYQDLFKQERINLLSWIAHEISTLSQLQVGDDFGLKQEINIQLRLNRTAFMSWFSTLRDSETIARIRQYIEKPENYSSDDVSKAYELLDSLSNTPKLRELVAVISQDYKKQMPIRESGGLNPSIVKLATHPFTYHEGTAMNAFDKISLLRQVTLFKDIPVESLQVLAEVAMEKDMADGEEIFHIGDESDGFYCIVSGTVVIKRDNVILSQLKAADYFGELGSLDNSPRTADAIATSNGLLLYINKEEFIRVLEDFPEMMRSIVSQIIVYLRSNLDNLLPGGKSKTN